MELNEPFFMGMILADSATIIIVIAVAEKNNYR